MPENPNLKERKTEKEPPLPENIWVQEKNRRDPANPTDIPAGLEDEAPMTDAMSAWIRANCKFAQSV